MKIIHNESEYNIALARIEELIDSDPLVGTDKADELDRLIRLVKKYEGNYEDEDALLTLL